MPRRPLITLVLVVAAGGCASAGPEAATAGEATGAADTRTMADAREPVEIVPGPPPAGPVSMPEDFSLDVTVLADAPSADAGAYRRPSRYVLFPDGTLHYADTSRDRRPRERGADWLPPLTRRIPSPDLKAVWRLVRELGFADPGAGEPPVNLNSLEAAPEGTTYAIVVAGDEVRRLFVEVAETPALDDRFEALVQRLAILAWADARLREPLAARPRRYDLGPDPYARYRRTP